MPLLWAFVVGLKFSQLFICILVALYFIWLLVPLFVSSRSQYLDSWFDYYPLLIIP